MGNHIDDQSRGDNENSEGCKKKSKIRRRREPNELVEVDPALYKEISEIVAHKGNATQLQSSLILINIVHRGRVPYLLKKSAKLTRNRQPSKQYNIEFGNIGPRHREGSRGSVERTGRAFGASTTPTIEMEEEKEERKESESFRRSITSR